MPIVPSFERLYEDLAARRLVGIQHARGGRQNRMIHTDWPLLGARAALCHSIAPVPPDKSLKPLGVELGGTRSDHRSVVVNERTYPTVDHTLRVGSCVERFVELLLAQSELGGIVGPCLEPFDAKNLGPKPGRRAPIVATALPRARPCRERLHRRPICMACHQKSRPAPGSVWCVARSPASRRAAAGKLLLDDGGVVTDELTPAIHELRDAARAFTHWQGVDAEARDDEALRVSDVLKNQKLPGDSGESGPDHRFRLADMFRVGSSKNVLVHHAVRHVTSTYERLPSLQGKREGSGAVVCGVRSPGLRGSRAGYCDPKLPPLHGGVQPPPFQGGVQPPPPPQGCDQPPPPPHGWDQSQPPPPPCHRARIGPA